MDPNLTLAHITHNTAVILLHQSIAYPSAQWQSCPINLPSSSSASTCITAATEVATIAQQFLIHSPTLTNPQFAFALFISARVLHAHANFHSLSLPPEFGGLISSLQEISRRWKGPHDGPVENLASRFASRLRQAQSPNSDSDTRPSLDIRQTAYSDQTEPTISNTPRGDDFSHCSPDSISLAFPPLPLSFQHNQKETPQGYYGLSNFPTPTMSASQLKDVHAVARQTSQVEMNMCDIPAIDYNSGGKNVNGGIGDSIHSFEELSQIFNDPFSSQERISTFAGGHGMIG
jgi:hypothetical protein